MGIAEIFERDIDRPINGVVKADQRDEEIVWQELEEYVITRELDRHFRAFFNAYLKAIDHPDDPTINGRMGVWISGFFGSGKSHLLKILGYLLSNLQAHKPTSAEQRRALQFFEDKLRADPLFLADIKRAVNDETDVILFNIDAKADSKDQRDAIISVFLRVFNEMQGFSGDHPHIAGMERYLVEQNLYDDFRAVFEQEAGVSWEREQDAVDFRRDEVITALTRVLKMSEESAAKWFDDARERYKINIEGFAKLVKEYLDRKGGKRRILFLVDEVGQFIGNSTQLMLTLQTITENLGTACRGRAWVLVTSQEDIEKVVGETNPAHAQDFSKIQGRFHTRLSLSSSNTDEVIARRLLEKKPEPKAQLRELFQTKGDILINQLNFANNKSTFRKFRDADDFAAHYPFAPHQFELLQKVFEAIRTHGASGRHLAMGERSMLSAFQSAAIQSGARPVGVLVPLYDFYPSIESFLDPTVKRAIDKANESALFERFDVQVLQVLFLIRYVDALRSNIDNLVTLCIDEIDTDRLLLKRRIEDSLGRLEKQNLISRNGDLYYFLTNEEQDVSREIKQVDVAASEINKLLAEIVFEESFNGQTKVRYKPNKTDYDFNRLCDAVPYRQANHTLTLEVITPLNDDYEHYGEPRCINRSSEGTGSALVRLRDDRSLGAELRTWLQVDKYVRLKNDALAPPLLRRILSDRADENRERRQRLRTLVTQLLVEGDVYILGQKPQVKASIPSSLLDEAVSYLIANTYTKLGYIKVLQDDPYREIKALLTANDIGQQALGLEGEEGNAPALRDVREYLKLAASDNRILLSDVVNRYSGRPYGWPEMETVLLITRLYMGGEISLMLDGGALDPKDAFDPLTKSVRHKQVSVLRRKVPPRESVDQARELFKKLFGKLCRDDADGVVADYREHLGHWRTQLSSYKSLADLGKYPGKATIDSSLARFAKQLAIRDTFEFVEALLQSGPEWHDLSDDVHDLTGFYSNQKPAWEKLLDAIDRFTPNLSDLCQQIPVAQAVAELNAIRTHNSPYGLISQIERLVQVVEAENTRLLKERRAAASERIDRKIAEVMAALAAAKAEDSLRNAVLLPLQKLKQAIQTLISLPQIEYDLKGADDLVESALERIDKEARPSATASGGTEVDTATPGVKYPGRTYVSKPTKLIKAADLSEKTFLESEGDVEDYLDRLRQALLSAVRAGHKARIQ